MPKPTTTGEKVAAEIRDRYELDAHEEALVAEIVRTIDMLDDLDRIVTTDGPILTTKAGLRVHPAAVEARQLRITLARLVAALRLPDDDAVAGRPQRRGTRGVYGIRGAV